jgi:hypothetical protein
MTIDEVIGMLQEVKVVFGGDINVYYDNENCGALDVDVLSLRDDYGYLQVVFE